jgi:hypothetical protein
VWLLRHATEDNGLSDAKLTLPDAVRNCLESLNRLAQRLGSWQADQPKRDRIAKLRTRAERRLSERHLYPFLDGNIRQQRASAAYLRRQAEYNEKVFNAVGRLTEEVRRTFEGLSPVLGQAEVGRLLDKVSTQNTESIAQTLHLTVQLVQRLEKFLRVLQPAVGSITAADTVAGRKTKRSQLLSDAQKRWGLRTPFSWVYLVADVDHKDAYNWKNGKLSDRSKMSQRIERVLRASSPPAKPHI